MVNVFCFCFFIRNKGLSLSKLPPKQPCCGDRYYPGSHDLLLLGTHLCFLLYKEASFSGPVSQKKLTSGCQVRPPVCLTSQVSTNMLTWTQFPQFKPLFFPVGAAFGISEPQVLEMLPKRPM